MLYVLVTGSRTWADADLVHDMLKVAAEGDAEVRVLAGGARGADKLAVRAAKRLGLRWRVFPADWNTHGKGAGFRRNQQMVELLLAKRAEGHEVMGLAFSDGPLDGSRGTADCVGRMVRHKIPVVLQEVVQASTEAA